jgi:hypothetical protein
MRRVWPLLGVVGAAVVAIGVTLAVQSPGGGPGSHARPASGRASASPASRAAARAGHSRRASAAARRCASVLFLGARGSGELGPGSSGWLSAAGGTDQSGLGPEVGDVLGRIRTYLAGRRRVTVAAVHYGADNVETLFKDPGRYLLGLSGGVSWTTSYLAQQAGACPHQQIVLAGYSQGAMVMHLVLHQLSGTAAGREILARVAAAVLIGDGYQVAFDHEVRYGTAPAGAEGVGQLLAPLTGASPAKFSPAVGTRVLSVCDKYDIVCDASSDGMSSLADLSHLASGLAAHLAYAGSGPLLRAADQAARDLIG